MNKETFGTDPSMMKAHQDEADHDFTRNSELIQQPGGSHSDTKQLIQEEKPPTQALEGLFSKLKTAKEMKEAELE